MSLARQAAFYLRGRAQNLIERRNVGYMVGSDAEDFARHHIARMATPEEVRHQRREVAALFLCLMAAMIEAMETEPHPKDTLK